MNTKTCTKCGKTLPATTEYFNRQKTGKYGLRPDCNACRKIYGGSYYKANREKINARSNEINTDESIVQTCMKCGKTYPATIEYFHRKKSGKYGLKTDCKDCAKSKAKTWNESNSERVIARKKAYREKK